jgi:hypothetical protein
VFRYLGEGLKDGAIYAFVRGESNAEVLLLVQARGNQWEYALVRCSSNELHATLDGNEVWTVPMAINWSGTPRDTFWVFYATSSKGQEPPE